MAYVDYKKAYDMIPHSWILKSLQLVGAADSIVNVLGKSMTKWKVQLNAGDKVLGDATSNVEYSKEIAFRHSYLLSVSYQCH